MNKTEFEKFVSEQGLFRVTADLLMEVYTKLEALKNPLEDFSGKELKAYLEIRDLCEAIYERDFLKEQN